MDIWTYIYIYIYHLLSPADYDCLHLKKMLAY